MRVASIQFNLYVAVTFPRSSNIFGHNFKVISVSETLLTNYTAFLFYLYDVRIGPDSLTSFFIFRKLSKSIQGRTWGPTSSNSLIQTQ